MKPLITTLLLIAPLTVFATTYTPLAPIPGVQSTDLVNYLVSLLKVLIAVAGLIAVIRIVICGFQLLSSPSPSSREKAKSCLLLAALGLLLALAAFVILETINPDLNNPKFDLPAIPAGSSTPQVTSGQKMCGSFAISLSNCNNNVPAFAYSAAAEATARQAFAAAGISINAPMCADTCSCSCTNIQGLPASVLNELKWLKQQTGANITLTGGTEAHLHVSHGINQPIFDISKGAYDALIMSWPASPSFGGFTRYLSPGGFYYTNESGNPPHWHVNP